MLKVAYCQFLSILTTSSKYTAWDGVFSEPKLCVAAIWTPVLLGLTIKSKKKDIEGPFLRVSLPFYHFYCFCYGNSSVNSIHFYSSSSSSSSFTIVSISNNSRYIIILPFDINLDSLEMIIASHLTQWMS